ncbi:hypothetical protein F2Q69_00048441 [Brassica cretica]|uniref:Uncharacterized protein n=1 Tax=Brassica cretica TaxID=69181 RepID=A0A8S9PLS0_BRACR|nr:hypothetical protein F2Q69_00048441 [Brassica cretica]
MDHVQATSDPGQPSMKKWYDHRKTKRKQRAAREFDSGQLPSGRMRNPNRPKGPRHRGPAKSLKDQRFPGNSAPKVHELFDDLKISGSSSPGPIRDFGKFISRYSGSQSQGQCDILAQTTLKNQRQELLKEPRVIWSRRSEPITRPRDLKDSKFKRPREEG